MFGASNPFGQGSSSTSPFGSQTQSVFGQNNNAISNNNPFAPKPFGASSPFGAQSGGSMFGGTSTGVFGQTQGSSPFGAQTGGSLFGGNSTGVFGQTQGSSPFGAQTGGSLFGGNSTGVFGQTQGSSPFGAQTGGSLFGGTSTGVFGQTQGSSPFGASSQGFGSSTPSFGAPSAPAFGNSTSPFGGGTSTFGQNNGFSTPQSNPFGSTAQQSQPAFGNSTFGSSSPFGASTTPAFGSTNTSPFGASTTPAFGSTNTSPFGASSQPAFGAAPTPAFGNSGTAFGNNAFGSGGAASTPSFGASTTSAFGFGSSPAFGQSMQSPFGAQGSQASTSTFGNQNQQGGSRVTPYASTIDTDPGTGPAGKFQSISAMTVHKEKCHEELRWEDYQRGDKGGKLPSGQTSVFSQTPTSAFGQPPANPTNAFQSTIAPSPSPFGQTPANSTNPFQSTIAPSSSPFGQPSANPTNTFQSTISPNPNPFGQPSANPSNAFQSTISPNPNPFGQPSANQTNTFQSTPNLFSQNTPVTNSNFSSPFGQPTTQSLFATSSNTTPGFGTSSGFATNTTQPFGPSTTPSFASTSAFSSFNSSPSLFSSTPGQGSSPAFSIGNFNSSQSAPLFSSNPSFAQPSSGFSNTQPSIFSTPSTGFPNMSTSSPSFNTSISPFSQTKPAGLTPQPTQPSFSFNNTPQQSTQPTQPSFSFNNSGQFNSAQLPAMANPTATQPSVVANPFGTLPAVPQISIGQDGNSPSIQYGISSLPVVDRPAPARVSPLLTSRHLLQRRVMLPARKYRPGDDSPKVPFFMDDEENFNTPKADASFTPRENPRALLIRPLKKETAAPLKDETTPLQENGKRSNGVVTRGANNENKNNGEVRDAAPVKANEKVNVAHETHGGDKNGSKSSPSRADIESLLPKLHHAEYFTEPRIPELAAKERANPGYTGRVRDFVVGRHGYGSIKFLGETDVRKLDLEKLIQFNNREVLVYMDESQKPPVGQGLNKPAEVTLLNIKCMDKKSGQQVKEGPRVEKYKEMLKRKAEEQGAQFVSYDAGNGEWKFKVEHF